MPAVDTPGTVSRPSQPHSAPSATPSDTPHPATDWPLTDAVDASDDLYALAGRIREQANAGDADALWALGQIFDQCELMAVKYGELVTAGDLTEARQRMALAATAMPPKAAGFHTAQFERCSGFVADPTAMENAKIWQTLAAEAGHPAATLRSWIDGAVEPVTRPSLDGVVDAMASGHPDALLLAPRLLQLRDPDTGAPVQASIADAAWSLALCDLGVDCSADAEITRIHCIFEACRADDTLADALRGTADPFVYREASALAAQLATSIRAGTLAQSGQVALGNRR